MRELSEDWIIQGDHSDKSAAAAAIAINSLSVQIRGALNAAKLCDKKDPVLVTHSSGNHALAISKAATLCGYKAHVVVAKTAPQAKQDAIRGLGATITNCPTKSIQVTKGSVFLPTSLPLLGQGSYH